MPSIPSKGAAQSRPGTKPANSSKQHHAPSNKPSFKPGKTAQSNKSK